MILRMIAGALAFTLSMLESSADAMDGGEKRTIIGKKKKPKETLDQFLRPIREVEAPPRSAKRPRSPEPDADKVKKQKLNNKKGTLDTFLRPVEKRKTVTASPLLSKAIAASAAKAEEEFIFPQDFLEKVDEIEDTYRQKDCEITRVQGTAAHRALLEKLINSAKDEILITTYSIRFLPQKIYDALKEARERDVTIRVYYKTRIAPCVAEFFEEWGITVIPLNIHGKHLVIDKAKVAIIGSFNWLDSSEDDVSDEEEGEEDGLEKSSSQDDRSIMISGNSDYVRRLRGRIFSVFIAYDHIASGYDRGRTPSVDFLELSLNHNSRILMLTTLKQHEDYLRLMCETAERQIVIYSPFLMSQIAAQRYNIIVRAMREGVALVLYVNEANAPKLEKIVREHPLGRRPDLRINPAFSHRKTFIVDDTTLSEGSFNWLSAATRAGSRRHNQETTLVIQGPLARRLLEEPGE